MSEKRDILTVAREALTEHKNYGIYPQIVVDLAQAVIDLSAALADCRRDRAEAMESNDLRERQIELQQDRIAALEGKDLGASKKESR